MSETKRIVALLGLVCAITFPASVAGQATKTEGEELFRQGRAAFGAGQYDVARDYFERSQKIEPAVGTLLNLAVCEEKLGRLARALSHLQGALDRAAPDDKRRGLIADRFAQIGARTPRVKLLSETPLNASIEVFLDSNRVAPADLGRPLPVDPGKHALDCAGPHGETCAQTFTIAEGQQVVRTLTVVAAPPPPMSAHGDAPPPPQPAPQKEVGANRSLPYALGAVGLAGIATGLVTGAAVLHRKSLVSEHCDGTGCDDDGLAAAREGKTFALISTVSTAFGVVCLGGSAWLLLSASGSKGPNVAWSIVGSF